MRGKLVKPSAWQDALAEFRRLCLADLFGFSRYVLGHEAMTEGFHRPIAEWQDRVVEDKALVLVGRGHFKTTLLTEARTVQRILRHPERRHLIASTKAENAEDMLRPIKAHLVSPLLVAAFPEILEAEPGRYEVWTQGAVTVKRKGRRKEATVETIGVEGEKTGKHYDFAVFDDVVGEQNSRTREELRKTIKWWQALQPLFDPGARQDFNATPWHYADLSQWLQEQARAGQINLAVYRRPAWDEVTAGTAGAVGIVKDGRTWRVAAAGEGDGATWVRPVFPERFSVPWLLAVRNAQPEEFASQYLLNPADESVAYFPRSVITPQIRPRRELLERFPELWIVMTVDPAISQQAWADYSAIAVTGWTGEGDMVVMDLQRGKWTETELVGRLYDAWRRYPAMAACGIEAVGFQKALRRLLVLEGERRGQHLPAVSLERDTRVHKSARIRTLKPFWDRGHVWIADDVPALWEFLEEAERYRTDQEAAHDDMLDALADALQLRALPQNQRAAQAASWRQADPDGYDEAELTEQIQTARAVKGMAPLDRGSLRMATRFKRESALADAWRRLEPRFGGWETWR